MNKKRKGDTNISRRHSVRFPNEIDDKIKKDAKDNFEGNSSLAIRMRIKERYDQIEESPPVQKP